MILPLVLSSHEEATVRCAKARPGSNSSTGSKAPVRLTTSGPHVLAKLSKLDPVFIDRCDARGVMQNSSHLVRPLIGMYGPPQSCKRKTKHGRWSAPMYSALSGVTDSGP
jgi:hypothetical protein